MDEQLRELINLYKHCNVDFKDTVQKAIDERKTEIDFKELPVIGLALTFDKMSRMVPEVNLDVVFFSDELTGEIVDFFVSNDLDTMNSDTMGEILRDGITGYNDLSDMKLLTQYMNYYDDGEPSELDIKVKTECEQWITVTIEQFLLK